MSRDIINALESLTAHIQTIAQEEADGYLLGMLKYVVQFTPTEDKKRFSDFLRKTLSSPLEEKTMTTLAQAWHEEGIQQGIQEGIQQGEYNLLIRLLEYKFKTIPQKYRRRLQQTDAQTLLQYVERVFEAHTLADIFQEISVDQ